MSNVYPLLPKLTLNRRFLRDFLAEAAPCFALGLVEERKQPYAVLALRPGVTIPPDITDRGFEFGHSLQGTTDYELIHFAFEFRGFATYNVLLNPNNPLVRTVVRSMVERGGYFVLAIDDRQQVTAFRADIGPPGLSGLSDNYRRIQQSSTTEAQYRKALAHYNRRPHLPGRMLEWVCRDDTGYLDLTTHRIEMAPAAVNAPADAADDQAPTGPEPTWQPLSMLPTVLAVIADELESAEELHASLVAARDRPHLLDDATIHRAIRLCESQQALVPTYREQLGRWRQASPSLSQREALKRLASHIARYERVVRESLSLAQTMAAGTIDTLLGLDDGELGMAVFEGRMKPADQAPFNEAMRVREQRAIAAVLDARIIDLEQAGIRDLDLFAQMGPQMPLFKRLMDIAGPSDLTALCTEYQGLGRYAKLLEMVAAGIQSGAIDVPH